MVLTKLYLYQQILLNCYKAKKEKEMVKQSKWNPPDVGVVEGWRFDKHHLKIKGLNLGMGEIGMIPSMEHRN